MSHSPFLPPWFSRRHALTDPAQLTAVRTLTYAASIALDFQIGRGRLEDLQLTGDVTFAASLNLQPGREIILRIQSDGSIRNLAFPLWDFVGGTAPATIAANKAARLVLISWGTTDANVMASYSVES